MPDILLFGATGFTGRLTAEALARRGASFAIAGRSVEKLGRLAAELHGVEVRVAAAGDVDALTTAARDVQVLLTCVGPFVDLGETAAEAAIRAGVHYVDSTGEGAFIERLITQYADRARAAGIAMAPAVAFDEVPADTAATLATRGMERAELVLTYAFPRHPTRGTIRSSLGIASHPAPWIVDGQRISVRSGERERWAPMPSPLGPRLSVSMPFAEAHLAPLHLDLGSLEVYSTISPARRWVLRAAVPVLKVTRAAPPMRKAIDMVIDRLPVGPSEETRSRDRWTILAEATEGSSWRNVSLQGSDPYGLTAEILAAGAVRMTEPSFDRTGVIAPVEVLGVDNAEKVLLDHGVKIRTYEPQDGPGGSTGTTKGE